MISLTSCTPGASLTLDVRTNYVAWVEFDRVQLDLFREDGPEAERGAPSREVSLPAGADGYVGFRVAELSGLEPGAWRVRARLMLGDSEVGAWRVRLRLQGARRAVTVLVTRECAGLTCPGDGSAEATGCLAGQCVDPECSPESRESCPTDCARDADCEPPPGEPACAIGWCIAGACATRYDDSRCGDGACLPELGCVGRRDAGLGRRDAGVPDAGSRDGGPPDAGPSDAGSDAGGEPARWVFVDSSEGSSCGLRSDGRLYCWGQWLLGIVGASETTIQPVPVQVANPPGFSGRWSTLSVGDHHICALDDAARAFCWGNDTYGGLGDDAAFVDSSTPVRVADPPGFSGQWRHIEAGYYFTCGIDSASVVYCWGRADFGRLGDGDMAGADRGVPARVSDPAGFSGGWSDVQTGCASSCAVDTAGSGFCWGSGFGWVPTAVPAPPTGQWRTIREGGDHRCALSTEDELFCWGTEFGGTLGDGAPDADQPAPVQVLPGTQFSALAVDNCMYRTCAVTRAGQLLCWGIHELVGEAEWHEPMQVLDSVATVGGAESFTCAVRPDGSAWCQGWGASGGLGNGSLENALSPVRVNDPAP